MTTKDSLICERDRINDVVLRIKQVYNKSKQVIIVVEGKDDVNYYGQKTIEYRRRGYDIRIIEAGNRKKVVDSYDRINWEEYSKKKILFIVDRDLSEYTHERTPKDINVYITDNYAIENDVCTFLTFVDYIRYACNYNEISDKEVAQLKELFYRCKREFYNIINPIMGLILYWKTNGIDARYSNVNCNRLITVSSRGVSLKENIAGERGMMKCVFNMSGIDYDESIRVEEYIKRLNMLSHPDHYVRGKYLLSFFVCFINYVINNTSTIISSIPSKKKKKQLGVNNAIDELSPYVTIPESLKNYLDNVFTLLTGVAS